MNNGITFIFAFSLGAVAGCAAASKYFKTKYERIAQEEIDSVKEVFSKRDEKLKTILKEQKEKEKEKEKEEDDKYNNLISSYTMEKKEKIEKEKGGSESMAFEKPYVISPDNFGDTDYDLIGLTYYADGVLTDDMDEPIDDVDDIVGNESLETFGEYEDDAVYVRNDRLECDYEILRDNRNYSDLDLTVDE